MTSRPAATFVAQEPPDQRRLERHRTTSIATGDKFGCCGGSSGTASSDTYRGPSAFSAPETDVVRDFVDSRVVGGTQQIKTYIDFHAFGELVLWPYGYTFSDVPADMTQDDRDAFVAMGQAMAATNGYTPQQASDLYTPTSRAGTGSTAPRIFAFAFEITVRPGRAGLYTPEKDPAQTPAPRSGPLPARAPLPVCRAGKQANTQRLHLRPGTCTPPRPDGWCWSRARPPTPAASLDGTAHHQRPAGGRRHQRPAI